MITFPCSQDWTSFAQCLQIDHIGSSSDDILRFICRHGYTSLRQTLQLNSIVKGPGTEDQPTRDDAPLRLKLKTSLTQYHGF